VLDVVASLVKYPAYNIRAYVLTALGELDDARAVVQRFAEFRRASGDNTAFGGGALVTWTWQELGVDDEILELIVGTSSRTPWLEAALAARSDWERAAEMYASFGSPVDAAFARLQTGRDPALRAALDFYRSVNAPFYVRQAEAKLAAIA
jgi:hypothetical protein